MVVAGYGGLGGFGKFCAVVAALGLIANMVPPRYSSGIDFQILGRWCEKVPRWVWNTFAVVIFAACALAGRDHLSAIFTNFLALMGYCMFPLSLHLHSLVPLFPFKRYPHEASFLT